MGGEVVDALYEALGVQRVPIPMAQALIQRGNHSWPIVIVLGGGGGGGGGGG